MSYLTFTFTECQTAQAAQIWNQNVHFNLLKKLCYEFTRADFVVIETKRFTETNCTRINAAHVIVKLSQGDSKNFHPPAYGALTWRTYVRYDNTISSQLY